MIRGLLMESFYEEQKVMDKGVLYPFSGHIQEKCETGLMAPAHIHDYIEILYCLSGNIKIYLNGKDYNFNSGDMILINSREVHSVFGEATDCSNKYIVIKFEPEVLYTTSKTIFEAKYVLPFTTSKSEHQKLFTQNEISETFIPELLHEIVREYTQKKYGFELAIRTHICKVFLWILRRWNDQGYGLNTDNTLNQNAMERLQMVFDYIDMHYQENITVTTVAHLCNMSYSYFSRFFKMIMKKNFSEYLNYVRITAAEKLLTITELNITEVSQEIGYSTSSYFIQQFKHFKNITPKQFKSYINENNFSVIP